MSFERTGLQGYSARLPSFSLCRRHVCRVWASLACGKGLGQALPRSACLAVFFSVTKGACNRKFYSIKRCVCYQKHYRTPRPCKHDPSIEPSANLTSGAKFCRPFCMPKTFYVLASNNLGVRHEIPVCMRNSTPAILHRNTV